jgi:tight adherence protein B
VSSPSKTELELNKLSAELSVLVSLLHSGLAPKQAAQYAGINLQQLKSSTAPHPAAFVWRVWCFALETGAAPSAVFSSCARALNESAENTRLARVQLAGPQSAARLVMGLPVLAILGGLLAGYNPLTFLLGTSFGWFVLGVAAGLIWLAHTWSHKLVSRAQVSGWANGMPADAIAMSISAGQSLTQARQWAQLVAQDFVSDPESARSQMGQCEKFLSLAQETGVAVSGLLRGLASLERLNSHAQSRIAVEKLSVQLMLPLGLCVLPAFIAVGVLPLVASVISSTALNT